MSRWNNLSELQQDHDTARRLLLEQGVVLADDPTAWAKLREVFTSVFLVLHREIMERGTLSLIYCYDQDKQPPRIAACDGYSSISEKLTDGRRVSSAGISVQALRYGRDYAVMVLLHELTHTLYRAPTEHGPEFHKHLDKLIAKYNASTGKRIKNDYFKDDMEGSR